MPQPRVEETPDFLASLGVALARLHEQLGEASLAYQGCVARYVEEKQHFVRKADCEWEEPREGADAVPWPPLPGAQRGQRLLRLAAPAADEDLEVEAPAAVVEVRDDGAAHGAAPPTLLSQSPRISFSVAPALLMPEGDALPHVRHEVEVMMKMRSNASMGMKMSVSSANDEAMHTMHSMQSVSDACSELHIMHGDSAVIERVISQRLLSRLGHRSTRALVSGHDLHQAVSAMGLERYSLKEMNYLVLKMALLIKLEFRPMDKSGVMQPLSHPLYMRQSPSEMRSLAERAVWEWPEAGKDGSWPRPSLQGQSSNLDMHAEHRIFIPIKALIKAMAEQDMVVKRLLGIVLCEQIFAIKEVLVAGDANRLVSELTHVRIDDLATRSPEPEISVSELLMGVLIISNGVVVGLQTEQRGSAWRGWFWLEVGFTCLFLVEILLRLCLHGFKPFFSSADYAWNLYDVLLAGLGIVECGVTTMRESDVSYSPMLRFIRLLKLMRLVRIFRLRFMWELQLMIKGLFGGARTLFWALVLLVFVMYILGVLTFTAFEDHPDGHIREMFSDIPTAMFSTFRCITSDCFTRIGTSATGLLMHEYGFWFAASFFVAYIGITLGVFNVILAIYVETTLTAAKLTEDANKSHKEGASIRVAHVTKRLLKLFCAAERSFNSGSIGERRHSNIKTALTSSALDSTEIHESTSISKELFLIVIQEPEVKKLMDELDLPPDRANLFDSIDADASGSLEATELVRGLLKVRGEVKKSDQVACILALRAVQATLREMGTNLQENRRMLEDLRSATVSHGAGKSE